MKHRAGDSAEDVQYDPFAEASCAELFQRVGPCPETHARFRTVIYHYYLHHRRDFAWRDSITPYMVFVSEMMLQQTQTSRVEAPFSRFVEALPDFRSLAEAPFATVLGLWKGLGYNRRARYLQETAARIVAEHDGVLPDAPETLVRFPGIGKATAASICVFAYNLPLVFIETNIRTVYLHFYFPDETEVDDRRLLPLIEQTLDRQRPRDWYYALMDYGVMLKKRVGNVSRRSKHYQRQSRFSGSDRQIRGKILQLLLDRGSVPVKDIGALLGESPARVTKLVDDLCGEGLAVRVNDELSLD